MTDRVRDAGYDDFLDALESGDGYYLECANGHGHLPPRRVCPNCGNRTLSETPLPDTGTITAQTTIHVATPSFDGETPYTTAIADFQTLRLTGVVRGDVENEATVRPTVGETARGERLVVFEPR